MNNISFFHPKKMFRWKISLSKDNKITQACGEGKGRTLILCKPEALTLAVKIPPFIKYQEYEIKAKNPQKM
jgi:hypothetical protein